MVCMVTLADPKSATEYTVGHLFYRPAIIQSLTGLHDQVERPSRL